MFGKIIDGKLIVADKKIKTSTGWVTNPTEKDLKANGYKEIVSTEKSKIDDTTEKLVKTYTDNGENIIVSYNKIDLSNEEIKNINQLKKYQELSNISQEDILKAITGDKDSIEKINNVLKTVSAINEKIKGLINEK